VTGKAFVFGPGGGGLAGATIAAAEAPEHAGTVADDGTFSLQVPSGGAWSFVAKKNGFHAMRTAALEVGASGLDQVGFQVPTDGVFRLLASVIQLEPDPALCQIATTVSALGGPPYGGPGVGEPDATVAIDPPLPAENGPIYFAYISDSTILPDRSLTKTTIDGGVLFVNVPPGDYTLTASKPGTSFTTVKLRCGAGDLVNAAPPRGLQVQ
jgi:hypothetical protein